MPEDLKVSQISSSPLPPPFRGLHSPGVRKHCQIIFACYFRKSSIVFITVVSFCDNVMITLVFITVVSFCVSFLLLPNIFLPWVCCQINLATSLFSNKFCDCPVASFCQGLKPNNFHQGLLPNNFCHGLVAKQFLPLECCQTIFATGVLPNNFPHERLASFPHWRVAKQISPRADGTERLYRSLQHVQLNPVQLIFPVHLHTGQTHKTCVNISVRVCTTYAKSATV